MRVLVVDNGSTDDSVREISSACPDIEILKLPNNLGFARGINAGIQYAIKHQADLILLLNNDTVVKANAITELARSLDCNQNWSISVPKICHFDEPERIWAAGCRWRRFPPRVTMIGLGKRDASKYNRRRELDFATGCALLVRRTVFEDIGGFDPAFSSYQEDYDFCFRARQAGHRLVYIPRAEILHKVSQSLGENTPVRWQLLGRNIVLFYRPGERFSWWAFGSFLAWVTMREIINGRIKLLPAYWRGIREGIGFFRETSDVKRYGNREL